jgi:hypothetical protein
VWTAPKAGEEEQKDHVSERKFIDESQEEEVILPPKGEAVEAALWVWYGYDDSMNGENQNGGWKCRGTGLASVL